MKKTNFVKFGETVVNIDRITHIEHADADEHWSGEYVVENPETTWVFFGPGRSDCVEFYDDEAATVWNYFTA